MILLNIIFWIYLKKNTSVAEPVIQVIRKYVSAEDNLLLTTSFTMQEFREAMCSIHPDKFFEPNGYSSGFYQQFWNLCSDDIFKECCDWLDTGSFPPDLNMTNISLISKGNSQVSMKDWRPTSLCNVLYKLVSKVLAKRLKLILHKCISDNQSTFVPDKSILDNAMVAIEILHLTKTKTKGNDKFVALKLDINKAYDGIGWDYLREVMVKMGFNQRWIQWMVMCIESLDYSGLVNEEHVGAVIPGRGLRQGDPLSPYMFIVCAEGLSSLIRNAKESNII